MALPKVALKALPSLLNRIKMVIMLEEPTKVCTKCKEEKVISLFHKEPRGRGKYGKRALCKICSTKQTSNCRRNQETKHRNRLYRKYNLLRYGVTEEQYEDMYKKQNGICAICKDPSRKSEKHSLHVDHDHNTGEIRGLLCTRCNPGIGFFDDNPELLIKAAKYLQKESD
jgi:hypothetical protein